LRLHLPVSNNISAESSVYLNTVKVSMKKKKFIVASIVLFILSIAAFVYNLQELGIFSKDKMLVRAVSCDECADFEIIMGNSKIASQLQGPSDSVNIYQAYMTGEPNPASADYNKTYDYYIVTGKVTALQKARNSGMIFPVITAYAWKNIVPENELISILAAVLVLIISIHYFIKFRKANRPDATAVVLKTHSEPPSKKK